MNEGVKSTKATWNEIISKKLKEGVSLEDLRAEYDSGILMDPNVVSEDVARLDHVISNVQPWINMASVSGKNASEINRLSLLALNQGANGLDLGLNTEMDVKAALETIKTEYLDVRITCQGWSDQAQADQKNSLSTDEYPNVRWIGSQADYTEIQIPSSDRVQSIQKAVSQITSDGHYDIIVTLSKNLLFEIASLRAIRILTENKNANLLARYDVEGTNELGDYDLIEKSYKVMSGIMGCADAVLTGYNGDESSRLALNIHNVLELESGFKNVMDPVGGSFYIEKLTGEIIEAVKK